MLAKGANQFDYGQLYCKMCKYTNALAAASLPKSQRLRRFYTNCNSFWSVESCSPVFLLRQMGILTRQGI